MPLTKTVQLGQLFTAAELVAALEIIKNDRLHFHNRARDEIVKPSLARINKTTGQENDPDYLAYALEAVLVTTPPPKP